MELEAKIADLGFWAKRYFFYNFFSKNFVWKYFSQNLKFYVCGLRSETENCKKYFLFWNFWKINPKFQQKNQNIFQDFLGIFWIYFFKNSKIKKEFFFKFSLEKCVAFFLDIWIYFFENSKIKIFILLKFSVNFLHVQLTRTDFQN